MADQKITELDANVAPLSTDLAVIVDDPGSTPATQKMTIDTLDDYLSATTKTLTNKTLTSPVIQVYDGWQNVNATWTYASATTITVPSGAAALYQKGDKFKLTANSVVLQGYIITVADELLTVVGDALTNHTFTANYYSHASNPIGFPNYFSWTPVLDGFSTNPSVSTYTFSLNGTVCHVEISQGEDGTSDATNFTITLPISFGGVGDVWGACGFTKDNGANLAGAGYRISAASSTLVTIYSDMTTGAWTASGAKRTRLATSYII